MPANQAPSSIDPPSPQGPNAAPPQHSGARSTPAWAAEEEAQAKQFTVTAGVGLAAGIAALLGGAVAVGAAHFAGSAKALAEEGIDPRVRLRAVPMAFQALAISTAACAVVGVAGFAGMHAGLPVRSEARVSSWSEAVALARQEREAVQAQFRARLTGSNPEAGQDSRRRG